MDNRITRKPYFSSTNFFHMFNGYHYSKNVIHKKKRFLCLCITYTITKFSHENCILHMKVLFIINYTLFFLIYYLLLFLYGRKCFFCSVVYFKKSYISVFIFMFRISIWMLEIFKNNSLVFKEVHSVKDYYID